MTSEYRERILNMLEPLFQEAEEKGLVFRANYQGTVFTPAELRAQHEDGLFLWGPANWQLVDPRLIIENAERDIDLQIARLAVQKKRFGLE